MKLGVNEKKAVGSRCFPVLMRKWSVVFCLIVLTGMLSGCASAELYTTREQAVEAFKTGDYEKARTLFEEALSYGNGEVSDVEFDILRYRAECELRLKDYEAAEKTYGILMQLDPSDENKDLYNGLQEQFDRVREINEAFRIMAKGDYEKAYEAMDRFAGLGGDAAEAMAWFNKAVCAEYLSRWDEAKQLFEDYLAVYPDDEAAQKEYAFLSTR